MFPAARLTDLTATGGIITAPGAPRELIRGMPAACVSGMGENINDFTGREPVVV
jgi:hypothetical protein